MWAATAVERMDFTKIGHFGNESIRSLRMELEKGFRSAKNGDVYTIEEAWEEIDQI